jgi:lipopolysaccharide export system permease protein
MIRKLDQYLLKYFIFSLLTVTVAIGLTIVVINMVQELRDFIDHNVPLLSILEYYVYYAGWVLKSFVPMFVLLSLLFSVSILARRHEILAMKASGFSLYRLTLPFALVTLVIVLAHFYYNEYVFPPANQKRLELKQFTIKKRSRTSVTKVRDVRRQISPGYFYTMANFDVDRRTGSDFKLYKTSANRLEEFITAERVVYDLYTWQLYNGIKRIFTSDGQDEFTRFDSLIIVDIRDEPDDLARRIGKPEDMSLDELRNYIDLMKRTGGPYVRESVDLEIKYAFPVTSFIVVLISIPFASNPRRGGIAVSFAAGALIALAYFVLFRISQSSGYNDKIPVYVAAWGVNVLFFIVGVVLMIRARK